MSEIISKAYKICQTIAARCNWIMLFSSYYSFFLLVLNILAQNLTILQSAFLSRFSTHFLIYPPLGRSVVFSVSISLFSLSSFGLLTTSYFLLDVTLFVTYTHHTFCPNNLLYVFCIIPRTTVTFPTYSLHLLNSFVTDTECVYCVI